MTQQASRIWRRHGLHLKLGCADFEHVDFLMAIKTMSLGQVWVFVFLILWFDSSPTGFYESLMSHRKTALSNFCFDEEAISATASDAVNIICKDSSFFDVETWRIQHHMPNDIQKCVRASDLFKTQTRQQKQFAQSLHFGVALKFVYRFLHKMVSGLKSSKSEKDKRFAQMEKQSHEVEKRVLKRATAGSSFKCIKGHFKLSGCGHLKQYITWLQTR